MTQLDVMFRFGATPREATLMAMAKVREVYGIRQLTLNERENTVRVEFDATRLTDAIVLGLLRRTGLDVTERVSLIPPPAPAAGPAESPAPAKA